MRGEVRNKHGRPVHILALADTASSAGARPSSCPGFHDGLTGGGIDSAVVTRVIVSREFERAGSK